MAAENVVEVSFGARTREFQAGVQTVKTETQSLATILNESAGRMAASLREPLDALAMMRSSLRETAEVAGAAFAVHEITEFARHMAELGERALNTSFALGISVGQLAQLQGVFTLAGGSADEAERTFRRLGLATQQALVNPNSTAAQAFRNLGVSMEELRAHGNDLIGLLKLLIDRYSELAPNIRNIGVLQEVAGRGVENLIPVLRQGADGYEELAKKSEDYQRAMTAATPVEAKEAELLNELKLEIMTLAHDGFAALSPIIQSVTSVITAFAKELDETIQSTKTDIENIMKIGDAVQTWLSQHSFGLIPMPARGTSDIELETTVTGRPGGRTLGTEGPARRGRSGGAKGQASELELWRAELQQQLEAENSFFKDSTKEELAFWQQKLALTKAGSKEQTEVESTIYQLRKRLAQQGLRDDEADESRRESLDRAYLASFEAKMKQLVATKKITQQQALGFDIQYTAQIEAQEKKRLEAFLNDDRLSLAEKQRYYDKLISLELGYDTKISDMQAKSAEEAQRAWQEATRQISDQFATAFEDVLTRTKSFGAAMLDLLNSLFKDIFKSLFSSLLTGSGGAGGGLAGLLFGSQGLSGALGIGPNGLLGSLFPSLAGGAIGSTGLLGGLLGSFGSVSGVGTADVVGTGSSGLLGMLASAAPAVPVLKGGWDVPHFASGGIVGMLHQREMVLPQNIADPLRAAIAGGNIGGGHTFNLSISALDGASVMRMGPQIVASLNRAMRNGSMLYQPT